MVKGLRDCYSVNTEDQRERGPPIEIEARDAGHGLTHAHRAYTGTVRAPIEVMSCFFLHNKQNRPPVSGLFSINRSQVPHLSLGADKVHDTGQTL
jgi:hypothetical protein